MTEPQRLDDGRILILARAETDGVIGDGMRAIGPDDPAYPAWDAYLSEPGPDMRS